MMENEERIERLNKVIALVEQTTRSFEGLTEAIQILIDESECLVVEMRANCPHEDKRVLIEGKTFNSWTCNVCALCHISSLDDKGNDKLFENRGLKFEEIS